MDLSAVDSFITDMNTNGLEWYSAVSGNPSAASSPPLQLAQANLVQARAVAAAQTPAVTAVGALPTSTLLIFGAIALGAIYLLAK